MDICKLFDSKKHLSVQKYGRIAVHIKVIEKPLGPAEKQHYGFSRFEFGTHMFVTGSLRSWAGDQVSG